MKTFVYGLLVGAAAVWLYVTQGAVFGSTLGGILGWRDGARSSVYGYGGRR
jgi:hypothetical protein